MSLFFYQRPCAHSLRAKGFRGPPPAHLLSSPRGLQASLTQLWWSQFLSHPLTPQLRSRRYFLNLGLPCAPQSAHSVQEVRAQPRDPPGERRKPSHSAWERQECHTLLQGLLSWGRDQREIYSPKLHPCRCGNLQMPPKALSISLSFPLLPQIHLSGQHPIRSMDPTKSTNAYGVLGATRKDRR